MNKEFLINLINHDFLYSIREYFFKHSDELQDELYRVPKTRQMLQAYQSNFFLLFRDPIF